MKLYKIALSCLLIICTSISFGQSNNSELPTSINEDGTAPDNSAILDIQSTSKGVLVPRLTTAQRTAIANPATGLLVYDTDTDNFWFYEGAAWSSLSGGGSDSDWTETATGIYHNTGNVAINTASINTNSNLYVFRPLGDYGENKSAIYGYRDGYASVPDSGGVSFSRAGIDAAIKGFSNWGNSFTAGIAGYSYLDYANSASVLGGQQGGGDFGALGFRDSTQIWAGYFNGDVRFRPKSSYSPELYLDIKRDYSNQGEFGEWHQLYVIPNARNTNPPNYDFYYLGDNSNHFDGLYCNAVNPESSLSINGTTVVNGSSDIGIGKTPAMKLHVKQDLANRGIRTEHQSDTDYWDTGIGTSSRNYKFYYNSINRADIASVDGAYIQVSDKNMKSDVEEIDMVLDNVLKLNPVKYFYKDSKHIAVHKSNGFIAQEVEAIFPELVRVNEDGQKALAYADFGILSIKAIQEQQVIIKELKTKNETLQNQINELSKAVLDLQNK